MAFTSTMSNGVLPIQAIKTLVASGAIRASRPLEERQYQPASLDLRLGARAYRVRSSFLLVSRTVRERLVDLCEYELDLAAGAVLEPGVVYIVPLVESLALPDGVHGRANPRSTTGRLDVFTRLITDYSQRFDEIGPGYTGGLFLEIVPGSFSIKVREGQCLNQIRLIRGDPSVSDVELSELFTRERLLIVSGGAKETVTPARICDGLFLRVDLNGSAGTEGAGRPVAYRSRQHCSVIDVGKTRHYERSEFWDAVVPQKGALTLQPEEFYLVGSLERVRVPLGYAAEIVAYDAFSGELRTHYAGFFDPGFGYGRTGMLEGTHAVLELRAHDVPFLLEHGQLLCRLRFERMMEIPDYAYGDATGSSYQEQTLDLPKQFRQ